MPYSTTINSFRFSLVLPGFLALVACGGVDELALPINEAPTASSVNIADTNGGDAVVNDRLIGNYIYTDAEDDAEGESIYRWLRNGAVIGGATTSDYILVTDDIGQSIIFEVTPVAISGAIGATTSALTGTAITSVDFVPNSSPIANAGAGQTPLVNDTVTLDGSSSSDGNGDGLTYSWSFTSVPAGSLAALSDSTAVGPSFAVDLPGTYVVQLIVNDGMVGSIADTVTIDTDNSAPVANAGSDQSAVFGDTMTLDGSASSDVDGDGVTYSWSFTSRPALSAAILTGSTTLNPTFAIDVSGDYVVQLIVNDGTVDSDPDTVIISTNNSAPVATAGTDQATATLVSDTVTLDGSASSDVDGDGLTFSWSFTSVPAGSTAALSDPAAVLPTFVVDQPGSYVVQLIVNDATVDSDPDTVIISTDNSPPVANAGPDQSAVFGDTMTLDGSASSDVDGDGLTYNWSITSKPAFSTATLTNPTTVNPTFAIDVSGDYVVQLIVNDGTVDSDPDTVSISTNNSAPVANAGADQAPLVSDTVTLDGSASSDVDGDGLTFSWSFSSHPTGSTTALSVATAVTPSFTVDLPGTYVVQLIVNDGTVNSEPVTVTIITTNSAPTASNVTISGGTVVGSLLTGNYDFADADGDAEGVSTFRWLRNGTTTVGTGATYTLDALDSGQTIAFEVTPVDDTGNIGIPATSAGLAVANSVPTASNVTISGGTVVGSILTGNYDFADADGDAEGVSTFRWLRNGTTTVGTGASYTLDALDSGQTIAFEVTPVDDTGNIGIPATSAGLAVANSVPTASNVTISGGTVVGSLLTGNYDFADADGDAEGVSTFRWLRNGTTTVGTGASYTLDALDSGQTIAFEVTPVDDTGNIGIPATSAGLAVANSVPTASNVTISGGTVVGSILTGNYDFADADGDAEGVSTFRWLRNGTTTVGTGASYTLDALDSGQTIAFEVTPVDETGNIGIPATSAGLAVANSVPTASNVTISGGTVVGSILTGNYDFADADGDAEGVSTFRWLRNGTTTVGTGASYTLDALDSGQTIAFEVTPVDDTGNIGIPVPSGEITVD